MCAEQSRLLWCPLCSTKPLRLLQELNNHPSVPGVACRRLRRGETASSSRCLFSIKYLLFPWSTADTEPLSPGDHAQHQPRCRSPSPPPDAMRGAANRPRRCFRKRWRRWVKSSSGIPACGLHSWTERDRKSGEGARRRSYLCLSLVGAALHYRSNGAGADT